MISSFFAWWFGQLAELMPVWLRRPALTSTEALIITSDGTVERTSTVTVGLRRSGREAQIGEFALEDLELNDLPRTARRPVVLRLLNGTLLEKTLVLPLAAKPDLNQVLEFEMDRETPFKPEEVYWNHRIEAVDRQNGRLSVRLSLMPQIALVPILTALARISVRPRWLEIANDQHEMVYLFLDDDGGRLQHQSGRLVWLAGVCCALLAVGAIVVPFVQQAAELSSLEREIVAGRAIVAQAESLQHEINQLSGTANLIESELSKAGRPLEILAALTRVIPDDTYLTELELRQRKVTLSGRSGGAARLIGALAEDDMFQNPAFAAPVTHLDASRGEVFAINTDVGPQR
jgi:general secretion pathway protein L